jgi:hypothetical protein
MKAPGNKRMALAAALVAALAFGLAGSPVATQATEAVGGTVTDTSRAGNANVAGLPRIQQQGDVSLRVGRRRPRRIDGAGARAKPLAAVDAVYRTGIGLSR